MPRRCIRPRGAAGAQHHIHPVETDAEGPPAAPGEVTELRGEGKRVADLVLVSAERPDPPHAEELLSNAEDLVIGSIRLHVALSQDRFVCREIGQLADLPYDADTLPTGSPMGLDDERPGLQERAQVVPRRGDVGVGRRQTSRLENPRDRDLAAHHRHGRVMVEGGCAERVQRAAEAQREIRPRLEHVQVVFNLHPSQADELLLGLNQRYLDASLRERTHGLLDIRVHPVQDDADAHGGHVCPPPARLSTIHHLASSRRCVHHRMRCIHAAFMRSSRDGNGVRRSVSLTLAGEEAAHLREPLYGWIRPGAPRDERPPAASPGGAGARARLEGRSAATGRGRLGTGRPSC